MSLLSLLLAFAIAAIVGSIGAQIAGRSNLGCLASAAVGYIGGLIGIYLARVLDLPLLWTISIGRRPFPVIWAIAGSALFVAIINFLSGRPSRSRR